MKSNFNLTHSYEVELLIHNPTELESTGVPSTILTQQHKLWGPESSPPLLTQQHKLWGPESSPPLQTQPTDALCRYTGVALHQDYVFIIIIVILLPTVILLITIILLFQRWVTLTRTRTKKNNKDKANTICPFGWLPQWGININWNKFDVFLTPAVIYVLRI